MTIKEKALKWIVDQSRPITYGIVQAGEDVEGGVPYIRPVDMSEEGGIKTDKLRTTSPEIAGAYKRSSVKEGDIVVSIGPSYGKVMIVPKELEGANLTQGTARVAVAQTEAVPRFIFWALRSSIVASQWSSQINATTFGGLNLEPLADTRIQVLDFNFQEKAACYLDRETALIDALVEKKTRFIELLREKRQALITHAVTKGLDPKAKIKDSGVEWLGEVPEHWEVKRLKFIARVQTGIAKGKDVADKDTVEVPYLRVANVQDGYLDLDEVATIEVSKEDLPRYLLQPGDVLMNEGGDFDKLGRGHVWQGEISPCIHQNHVFAVRPHGVGADWLNTFTSSSAAQFYFMGRSKQSTNLASISSSNLMELAVPVPNVAEQRDILGALEAKRSQLDALIQKTERSINLLK